VASHIRDLKIAASEMTGEKRRSFQAEMAIGHCEGSARKAETVFGRGRDAVRLGLRGKRPGIACLGAYETCCGRKPWEDRYPEVASALWKLADTQSRQDPTSDSTFLCTRPTAAGALQESECMGFPEESLPPPGTMSEVPNRDGYRLRPVVKARPQKKFRKQTPSLQTSERRTDRRLTEARQSVWAWIARLP